MRVAPITGNEMEPDIYVVRVGGNGGEDQNLYGRDRLCEIGYSLPRISNIINNINKNATSRKEKAKEWLTEAKE